jgi:tetratricopeptide (TPR) repeat protein
MMMDNKELTYLNTLAVSCLATGMIDEAQPAFELINGAAPMQDAGPVGLASVELARGNYDKAVEILKQCADENRVNAENARKLLMHALVATNRLDEADELRDSLTRLDAANDEQEYLVQSHKFFGTGDPRLLSR